jgi:hypothetical protein
MANTDRSSDGTHYIRLANEQPSASPAAALSLCVNIIRIGTTLILPDGERFGRDDINASLSLRLVLALATLDEISRQHDDASLNCTEQG